MNCGQSLFAQLMDHLPRHDFASVCTLRRQLSSAEFLVLGPVSLHGVCAVDFREVCGISWRACVHRSGGYHWPSNHWQRSLWPMHESRDWRIYAISRRSSAEARDTLTRNWGWTWPTPYTPWTHHRRSVHDDVPGRATSRPARLKLQRCWICVAPFPHLFALPRRRCTMSISWTHSRPRPARST